jgi:hypothetical protein
VKDQVKDVASEPLFSRSLEKQGISIWFETCGCVIKIRVLEMLELIAARKTWARPAHSGENGDEYIRIIINKV